MLNFQGHPDDHHFQSAEKRQNRLSVITGLLEKGSQLKVPKIGRIWPELDMELLGRDLGWSIHHDLQTMLLSNSVGTDPLGMGITLNLKKYFLCGRVVDYRKEETPIFGSQAKEGDFIISFAGNGCIESFTVQRFDVQTFTHPVFGPQLKTGSLKETSRMDFMRPQHPPAARRQAAEIADLLLLLLKGKGIQNYSQPQRPTR